MTTRHCRNDVELPSFVFHIPESIPEGGRHEKTRMYGCRFPAIRLRRRGGGDQTSPNVYKGVTTAAPLDNTLEAGQFACAILGPSEAGVVGALPLSTRNINGVPVPLSIKTAVLRAFRMVIPPVRTASAVRPMAVYSDTLPGAEGGTATIRVTTGVWQGGTVYTTKADVTFVSFDDVADGIANPINGTMTIVPDSWLGDGTPDFYEATFDLHVSLDPDSGGRITGSLDHYQVSNPDFSHSTFRLPNWHRTETGLGGISPDGGLGQSDHHGPRDYSRGAGGTRFERKRHHGDNCGVFLGGTGLLIWAIYPRKRFLGHREIGGSERRWLRT